MNSKFTVTDSGGFSPLDLGVAEVMKVPPPQLASTSATRKAKTTAARDGHHFKVFTSPQVGNNEDIDGSLRSMISRWEMAQL